MSRTKYLLTIQYPAAANEETLGAGNFIMENESAHPLLVDQALLRGVDGFSQHMRALLDEDHGKRYESTGYVDLSKYELVSCLKEISLKHPTATFTLLSQDEDALVGRIVVDRIRGGFVQGTDVAPSVPPIDPAGWQLWTGARWIANIQPGESLVAWAQEHGVQMDCSPEDVSDTPRVVLFCELTGHVVARGHLNGG